MCILLEHSVIGTGYIEFRKEKGTNICLTPTVCQVLYQVLYRHHNLILNPVIMLSPFYTSEAEIFDNLQEVTQLVSGTAGIEPKCLTLKPMLLFCYTMLPPLKEIWKELVS